MPNVEPPATLTDVINANTAQLQNAGEQRLLELWERGHTESEDDDFCGCDTCVVREVLDATLPLLVSLQPKPAQDTSSQRSPVTLNVTYHANTAVSQCNTDKMPTTLRQ